MLDDFTHEPRIAYFSMEIALHPQIPTYSGGLGILAGDTIRSAADLEMPMVAVTLVSREGYFHQEIDAAGRQVVVLGQTAVLALFSNQDPIGKVVRLGCVAVGCRTSMSQVSPSPSMAT